MTDTSAEAVERLAEYIGSVTEGDAYAEPWTWREACRDSAAALRTLAAENARLRAERDAAYQRGAETMREAATWATHDWAMGDKAEIFPHDAIRALPIPDKEGEA